MRKRARPRRRNKISKPLFGLSELILLSIGAFTAFALSSGTPRLFSAITINFVNFFIYLGIGVIFISIGIMIYRHIKKLRRKYLDQINFYGLHMTSQVDDMDHYDFEKFAGFVLENEGCTDVEVTKRSGDGGIDLKLKKNNRRIVVQVKHYKIGNNIGRPDLQKLVGAYINNADEGWFITTSKFTLSAKLYALGFPSLRLIDRAEFGLMMARLPDNDWVERFILKPMLLRR